MSQTLSKRVSVVIPTYNEAQTIRGVVEGFFATGLVAEGFGIVGRARFWCV